MASSQFSVLPADLFRLIIENLPEFADMAKLRLVSKGSKAFADQIICKPENVVKIFYALPEKNLHAFFYYYLNTAAYKELNAKALANPPKLNSIEKFCYSLVTHFHYSVTNGRKLKHGLTYIYDDYDEIKNTDAKKTSDIILSNLKEIQSNAESQFSIFCKLSPSKALFEMIEFCRDRYKEILDNPDASAFEIICHALTVADITKINPQRLEKAIEEVRIQNKDDSKSLALLKGLQITLTALKPDKSTEDWKFILAGCNGYINLAGVDFEGENLSHAKFVGCNLSSANLKSAILVSANLSLCLMDQTNLNYATLRNANLSNSDLHTLHLEEARFENTNLRGVNIWDNLRKTTLNESRVFEFPGTGDITHSKWFSDDYENIIQDCMQQKDFECAKRNFKSYLYKLEDRKMHHKQENNILKHITADFIREIRSYEGVGTPQHLDVDKIKKMILLLNVAVENQLFKENYSNTGKGRSYRDSLNEFGKQIEKERDRLIELRDVLEVRLKPKM